MSHLGREVALATGRVLPGTPNKCEATDLHSRYRYFWYEI